MTFSISSTKISSAKCSSSVGAVGLQKSQAVAFSRDGTINNSFNTFLGISWSFNASLGRSKYFMNNSVEVPSMLSACYCCELYRGSFHMEATPQFDLNSQQKFVVSVCAVTVQCWLYCRRRWYVAVDMRSRSSGIDGIFMHKFTVVVSPMVMH